MHSASSTAYMSFVSLSAMQLIVTLTTEEGPEQEAAAAGGGGVVDERAWIARWTVNDLPVPGSPLM